MKTNHIWISVFAIALLALLTACNRSATTDPLPTQKSSDVEMAAEQTAQVEADAIIKMTYDAEIAQQTAQANQPQPTTLPTDVPPSTQVPPTVAPVVENPTAVPPVATALPAPAGTTYTVQAGDWMWAIARKLNIDPNALIAANPGIDPANLQPGQVINLPNGTAPQATPATGRTHIVAAGENLFRIAQQYNTTYEAIAQANSILPPYVLYPGQVLNIP
ncbi:MAG TPA: LysM peptidoglycan-binding domain-containing protein [Anaerolineales bacterium]|nr:LysM peptidoglycan-binding domain-containing protein [Anaerolineales bacterium]